MAERLLGQETEYGLSVVMNAGLRRTNERAAEDIYCLAGTLPHLPALRSSGVFLANGSRFYVDCGHPEVATPECANPWDVVRYVRAGEWMLLNLAAEMKQRDPSVERTLILKSNIDYTSRATWGCHESYLHSVKDQTALSSHIIPHLVSRIVFAGAGGFDCFSPGLDFMVSPRVAHLGCAISGNSTGSRGIFHTRDEPLCGKGYKRLHLLCGESLCGETGAWLKVATTALVVALIDAGRQPGAAVQFRDPVAAMRIFADDPACRRTAPLGDGREVTALEVQEHFLQQAEACAEAAFMPPWAGEVCRQWRAMLDRLRHGPALVGRSLDWAIKLALFQSHARRRETTLEALALWTPVLDRLAAAHAETDKAEEPLTAELILGRRSPLAAVRKAVTLLLGERGLHWDGLADFLRVRLEFFALDTRFGLLGEGGLFAALEAGGAALDHRFPGVDNIAHALENPPASGRAAIRGGVIRRVAGQNGRFAAEWEGVWDLQADVELNLTDPFCTEENWGRGKKARVEEPTAERLFRTGNYAALLVRNAIAPGSPAGTEDIVLAHARLGRRDEALALLDTLPPERCLCHPVALRLSVLSNGLVPALRAMEPVIALGERLMEEEAAWDAYSRAVFLAYKAHFLLHQGRYQLAEPLLRALLADDSFTARSRMSSRARCHLAELYRRLGRPQEAADLVYTADLTLRVENLTGDMAAHSLPMQARLARDTDTALIFLENAESAHLLQRNQLGLAHVLCLRARRLQDSRDREQIELLQRTVPALAQCGVARRIVREWDSWVAPDSASEPMNYWGL